jgi:hypothetical protein
MDSGPAGLVPVEFGFTTTLLARNLPFPTGLVRVLKESPKFPKCHRLARLSVRAVGVRPVSGTNDYPDCSR